MTTTKSPDGSLRRHRIAIPGSRVLLRRKTAALIAATALGAACLTAMAAPAATTSPGSEYVALGSSFAAGAGLLPVDPADTGALCGRSLSAYPNLVAERLGLALKNATCGGATIDNIVSVPQQLTDQNGTHSLAPQIQAVDTDTRLVTVTVGGNDVKYVTNLIAQACRGDLAANPQSEFGNLLSSLGACDAPSDAEVKTALRGLRDEFVGMVRAVRSRAPQARIVLVDYLTILPANGEPCAVLPIPEERQRFLLNVARELSLATRTAARHTGVEFVAASKESRHHDVCSSDPWTTGYEASPTIMHPNTTGHAAVAGALIRQLEGRL
ncbi:SGNH/GDSL hydrolase family protein [Streptomyces sp. NPDC004539]|uniref:SGNH/GDSL hydrolase family protein n=1 Tax=Streptomyces sp. NPDC004539 TaxID=3154280 RepID=UPI0033AA9EA4